MTFGLTFMVKQWVSIPVPWSIWDNFFQLLIPIKKNLMISRIGGPLPISKVK